MNTKQQLEAAINMIGFEYFLNCIKNGATPEQAKKEMMTETAQKIIMERARAIFN